ncbi:MAG: bifunctional diaminohydroxyphosphoribosylaminopyrimidine deaminase/5-amino-6-(5-phosphoribosylamino)uracil reductase RibD [Candidatus Omnitrophota bacterium]|nr:MAG: bifunctional diaminohydroxyphosphoribosylaminopyrimidine deaminase/5-amino-6-(5-phosphoribosylamino)uracil reductase RibD [Candidatus Omnitrophota bacterium]
MGYWIGLGKERQRGERRLKERMRDEEYMRLVLKLAQRGKGKTSPNPLVGALVVRKGEIVGKGYHQRAGGKHAEIIALDRAKEKAKGATLYVNLEPCASYGRTPPCVDRIIKQGIRRVVIGMIDPNPLNRGKGIRRLRANNIAVKVGVLQEEAERINRFWSSFITQGKPYVILKIAQSLDGQISTCTGDSKWITSSGARRYVHRLRTEVDAVLVGINTVLKDNPLLSARLGEKKLYRHQPIKVVLDSHLRIPLNAKLFSSPGALLIATTSSAPVKRIKELERRGARVLMVRKEKKKVSMRDLMQILAKEGIVSILIEGGREVFISAIESRIVDEVQVFIAPKIIGRVSKVSQAFPISNIRTERIGKDLLIRGECR